MARFKRGTMIVNEGAKTIYAVISEINLNQPEGTVVLGIKKAIETTKGG